MQSVLHQLSLILGPCKKGHYCIQSSSAELPCTEGTYSNITGSFTASNCRICPINSYCPSGSALPKQCPKDDFNSVRLTRFKLYQGKRKRSDCRNCPVDPCDKEGMFCATHTNQLCGISYLRFCIFHFVVI